MTPPALTSVHTAILAAAIALSWGIAQAQPAAGARAATSDAPAPVRTGKERLGNKWSDEQRVDNCKVPPDKRGAKSRSDTCPSDLTH